MVWAGLLLLSAGVIVLLGVGLATVRQLGAPEGASAQGERPVASEEEVSERTWRAVVLGCSLFGAGAVLIVVAVLA
ncbi:MAG: hypothetical protein M3133_01970 [Actinomycetota bacterium]|nr:hypothetical protein [Actinomycetota bacterium]